MVESAKIMKNGRKTSEKVISKKNPLGFCYLHSCPWTNKNIRKNVVLFYVNNSNR